MQRTWHTTSYNRNVHREELIGADWFRRKFFELSLLLSTRATSKQAMLGTTMPCSYHNKVVVTIPHKHRKNRAASTQFDSSHLEKISNIPKPEAIPFELTEEWRKGCRATVYLSLIKHDSVYNGPSTARHCFSQGLEDQPPRYPRGQTVKGSQTLVTFHQMG